MAVDRRMSLEVELARVAGRTFEEFCFMFPEPHIERDTDERAEAAVSVEFTGPRAGKLVLKAYDGLYGAIADSMLGLTETASEPLRWDALGEICNIICGNLLPSVAGRLATYDMGTPKIESIQPACEDETAGAAAKVELALDGGWAELILILDNHPVDQQS